jgi:hypothetical protein
MAAARVDGCTLREGIKGGHPAFPVRRGLRCRRVGTRRRFSLPFAVLIYGCPLVNSCRAGYTVRAGWTGWRPMGSTCRWLCGCRRLVFKNMEAPFSLSAQR